MVRIVDVVTYLEANGSEADDAAHTAAKNMPPKEAPAASSTGPAAPAAPAAAPLWQKALRWANNDAAEDKAEFQKHGGKVWSSTCGPGDPLYIPAGFAVSYWCLLSPVS